MTQASSAAEAADRTAGFESPICFVISPATPWPCLRSAIAGPTATATLPAIASACTARFRLLSLKRFVSAGSRSPVLGAILNPAPARTEPTDSTAAARIFHEVGPLVSAMSPMSFSVIRGEMSALGRPSEPPESLDVDTAVLSTTRTVRHTLPFPSNGFLTNSASRVFIVDSLTSCKKSFSPGPNPACMTPSIFAAAALHCGLVKPSDALHQSIASATPHACTPNSKIAPAQNSKLSEVTLGFLCPSALLLNCENTNAGPSASATLVKATLPGPRSLTSTSFSAMPCTTQAPSFFEKDVAFPASAPKASNTFPKT